MMRDGMLTNIRCQRTISRDGMLTNKRNGDGPSLEMAC